jgi:hypothetical protein
MTMIANSAGPRAIHALVIGVGDYPWLIGGDQPTFHSSGGMGQLSSAPASAREFARWFVDELSHPTIAEKSLDLLISDQDGDIFDSGGAPITVERAIMSNVEAAINRWVALGDADEDSIMMFFFCGHGLGKGNQTILLMEDFGSLPGTNSLKLALDFNGFMLGMDQCKARQQCYFVDACRVGTPFALNTLSYFGDPVMIPAARVLNRPRSAPVFYSAVPGTPAYGQRGKPSFFTSALLKAFEGAGSDDTNGPWRVETEILQRGIRVHLQRSIAGTSASGQLTMVDGLADSFTIHQLGSPPIVPVEVTCNPESHNQYGHLRVSDGSSPVLYSAVTQGSWQLDLAFGNYQFEVDLPNPSPIPPPVNYPVRPPSRRIVIPIP